MLQLNKKLLLAFSFCLLSTPSKKKEKGNNSFLNFLLGGNIILDPVIMWGHAAIPCDNVIQCS